MNERNVAALADFIEAEIETFTRSGCVRLAEALAARGVLVPSALTGGDMQSQDMPCGADFGDPGVFLPREELVAALERIAKGE